ncbi:sigma 54-interacting transcriptional regulator, partial [Limnobacter sp. CACIAM 66H1]
MKAPLCANSEKLVAKVAPTDSTVLLTGESGSGKEVLAQHAAWHEPA